MDVLEGEQERMSGSAINKTKRSTTKQPISKRYESLIYAVHHLKNNSDRVFSTEAEDTEFCPDAQKHSVFLLQKCRQKLSAYAKIEKREEVGILSFLMKMFCNITMIG